MEDSYLPLHTVGPTVHMDIVIIQLYIVRCTWGIPLLILFKVVRIESNVKHITSAALLCVHLSLNNVSNFAVEDKPCHGEEVLVTVRDTEGTSRRFVMDAREEWLNRVFKGRIQGRDVIIPGVY